ncbi:MAG: DUF4097 family beta strand repeat protein, partial [bacterium]|nr:DUF4097 family beta strand repeat protein [bacterium]MCP5065292.1 DUF4097 family beta strand repeat protein [bacterium]
MTRTIGIQALGMALVLTLPAALAAEDLEATIPMEPGGHLRIELPSGRIEIDSHDEPTVDLNGHASGRFRFEVEESDNEVLVRGRNEGFLSWFQGRVDIHVRVPSAFSLDLETGGGRIDIEDILGDVRARTSGGSIELEQITGDVEVVTSGGRIQAQEIDGNLKAETSGGRIHVSEVNGDVDVHTSGGRIRIREAAGEVRAMTSGGPIEVRFDGQPSGKLETSGGSIEVEVPENLGFDLDAETSGGRVELDDDLHLKGETERSKISGEVNGGGPSLSLETSGGNIQIQVR